MRTIGGVDRPLDRCTERLNRPPFICRMLIGIPNSPVFVYHVHLSRRSSLLTRVAQEYDFVLYSPYVRLGAFGEVRASPVALRRCDRRRLAWTHQGAGPGAPLPDHPALRTSDSGPLGVRQTASLDQPSRGIGDCRLR